MRRNYDDLTAEEKQAITALQRLAKKWPQTLVLFSMSGSLVIMDRDDFCANSAYAEELARIKGIPNDGGDR